MDLHYLRIFYEVAKEKSFTKAANKLYINQSAVSIQVKKFEDILKTKLFDRTSKKIKLTYAGEALYQMADDIFDKVKRAEREITKIIETDKFKIVIGATSVIAEPLLPRLLKEFSEKHSEIEYEVLVSRKDYLLKALKEGSIDVLIIDSEHIVDSNLEIIPIDTVPYILIGKKEYTNKERLGVDTLISRKDIPNNNKVIECLEKKYRINFAKKIVVQGNTEVIKAMVREGIGNAILPLYAVRKELSRNEFREIEKIEEINDGYQIVITKDKRNILAIIKFIKFIQNHKMQN